MNRHATAAVAASLLLLTACGGTDEGSISDQPADGTDSAADEELPVAPSQEDDAADDPDGGEVTDPSAGGAAGSSDPLLGPEIEVAMADVTERAGVERDAVLITGTDLVTWPDGAAGCPEPGMTYTQSLVDGYRIVLEVDGEEYTYVGAAGEDPTYCAEPQQPTG